LEVVDGGLGASAEALADGESARVLQTERLRHDLLEAEAQLLVEAVGVFPLLVGDEVEHRPLVAVAAPEAVSELGQHRPRPLQPLDVHLGEERPLVAGGQNQRRRLHFFLERRPLSQVAAVLKSENQQVRTCLGSGNLKMKTKQCNFHNFYLSRFRKFMKICYSK